MARHYKANEDKKTSEISASLCGDFFVETNLMCFQKR